MSTSSTSQTDKTDSNNENDIDPLAENLDLSSLEEGLQRALTEERAASPTTPERPSPSGSEETEDQGRTRRNTIAATTAQRGATSLATTPIMSLERIRQIIASLTGGTRKPKAKKPEVYRGERHKLQGWMAQLIAYYRIVGWQNGHDEERILYATSLLRDDAGTWITPYAEERITPTGDNWAGLKVELQRQFGVIDAKAGARIKLKNMKQGKRSVTEYWNEFRLVASEAELDDSTGGELLLEVMIAELQNASGASCEEYEDLETLAQWAIKKETKLATVRHIQGSPLTKNVQQETITPRNRDATYRPRNNGNQNYRDPVELDVTQRRPRFNVTREEFQRRIRGQLCLTFAQARHLARSCQKKDATKPFKAQARSWQPAKKTAPWQTRPNIREIEVEQESEQSGNDDCPQ